MKKRICILLFITILLITAILMGFDMYTRKANEIKFDFVRVLINRDAEILADDKDQLQTLTVDFFGTGDNAYVENPSYLDPDKKILLYLKDDSVAAVESEADMFKLYVFSPDGEVRAKINLPIEPEQMVEYSDGILLKLNSDLYFWDYSSHCELEKAETENFTENSEIFVYGTSYMYTAKDCVYLYKSKTSAPQKIKTKATCRGFLNDGTVLFTKDINRGYICIYRYDIKKNFRYKFRIISIPAYMPVSTVSPDGKYLMCISSNDSGIFSLYIYDTNTFAKVKMDFPADAVKSLQWVK